MCKYCASISSEFEYVDLSDSLSSIVDSDKRYDESRNIKVINKSLNCNSNIIKLDKKNFLSKLIEITNYSDSPIATISYFVLLLHIMRWLLI